MADKRWAVAADAINHKDHAEKKNCREITRNQGLEERALRFFYENFCLISTAPIYQENRNGCQEKFAPKR